MGAGPTFFLKGVEGHITSHGGGGGADTPMVQAYELPLVSGCTVEQIFFIQLRL